MWCTITSYTHLITHCTLQQLEQLDDGDQNKVTSQSFIL